MRDGRKGIAQKEQGNDLEFAIKINRGKLDSRKAGFAEFFRTRLGRMCGVCGKRRSPWQPFQQGKDTRVPISNPEQAVTKQDKSFVFQSGQSELVGKANGVGRGRTGGNVPRVVLRRGSEARKIRELRNENFDKT